MVVPIQLHHGSGALLHRPVAKVVQRNHGSHIAIAVVVDDDMVSLSRELVGRRRIGADTLVKVDLGPEPLIQRKCPDEPSSVSTSIMLIFGLIDVTVPDTA